MKVSYDCKYKDRLFVILTEFYNFYSKMYEFNRVAESQINVYLRHGLNDQQYDSSTEVVFDVAILQNYFRNNQGESRQFSVTIGGNKLLFSADVWTTITARRKKQPPMFQAGLMIDGYRVEITCHDDMAFKLVSTILTKIAFINGPAYTDMITVDGETFKMAYYIAACFYKLGGDPVGYLTTLDEACDLS